MADKRGKCLVAVFANVPQAIEEEYNRWYDTHHIPERLKVPGFLGAARYVAEAGDARYLTLYELAHAGVFKDPLMVKLNDEPSEWDQRISPQVQVVERVIYDRVLELGEPPEHHAAFASSVRFEPPADMDAEFNDWYNTEHLPGLAAVPGVLGARRYRKRWGDGSKYMALYEFESETIPNSEAWQKAAYAGRTRDIGPKLGTPKLARHRRIFEARATG